MNLKSLDDQTLLSATDELVKSEREILSKVLHHLKEIERRRLFSDLKYGSLFEYATKRLGYSEDQAYRRIQAMRLLKELPQIEEKINKGTLSLSHLGMAQTLFKKESATAFTQELKMQLLETLENTSKREAERIITTHASSPLVPEDRVRPVTESEIEIKFAARKELADKIEQLKAALAHKAPGIRLGDLFEKLCDLGIEEWISAPARVTPRNTKSKAQTKREVKRRAHGRCTNCNSSYALEIDHIVPRAIGGSDNPENLRLLCRACNQRAAIRVFGTSSMERYL